MKVLWLTADALRRDYLGCYGAKINTHTVDNLAKEGVKFDQAITAATWTPPSTAAFISGIYPHRLGIQHFFSPWNPKVKTIFHYFADAGYEVGSFVFEDLFSKYPFARVQGVFRDYQKPLAWIKKNSKKEFFLYLHYFWTHGPYEPQDSAEAWSSANHKLLKMLREDPDGVEKCKKLYKKAVERMDEEWLSPILDTLEKEGILDETLIIFTSDHGESWGERIKDKSKIRVNFDLHGRFLYDELLRVPLILRMPDILPAGSVIKEQVRTVDIMPTILDIAGIERDRYPIDGLSLMDYFNNRKGRRDRLAISSATDDKFKKIAKIAIRTPKWKMIWTIEDDFVELYNLDTDPGESRNVADNYSIIKNKVSFLKKLLLRKVIKNEKKENTTIETLV